ncbi:transcriptional regulator, AsnC family [Sphingobium faniae]|nr:transcriptional regulator, AsnC family [Sphingobium faniae]
MPKIPYLDPFDRRLLERARRNNLEPARIAAEKVGLSISAVLRRLRRLRDEKVIIADIAVVSPLLTGSALTLHVLVRMHEPGRRVRDGFARSLERHPEITGAWEVTGDDDYVLKVQVGSMAEYDAFIRRALGDDNGVLSFKTLITISTIVDHNVSDRPLIGA